MATQKIPLSQIVDNPFQARTQFDPEALRSLADEMKAEGFWAGALQGRRTKNGKVELVFGHRRLRALKLLKTESVPVEIVQLTDAQMALRGLEENLQREGLTDLEKADAVKEAVKIAHAELVANGKPGGQSNAQAIEHTAKRLGLGQPWVYQLCQISSTIVEKNRELVEKEYISAKTAMLAKQWGGDQYVKTLAKQGKKAKEDQEGTKPSENTVAAMKKVVRQAPEAIQEKLKTAIVNGEITSPKEAEQKGRRMAAERTKRNKLPPPDLETVLVDWTHRFDEWNEQMQVVAPYMEYVTAGQITSRFRAALKAFIATAETLLEDAAPPMKSVGRSSKSS